MKRILRNAIGKLALAMLPDSDRLRYIAYRPKIETWLKLRARENHPIFGSQTEMFVYLNKEILSNRAVHYLEFGVYQGESIKFFAQTNTHPDSRFVGFDTFTGLPEDWGVRMFQTVSRTTFDTRGAVPQTDDRRISFVKGLFQESLPSFRADLKPVGPLVIHNDSDLYSSTLYVLTCLNDILVAGTIVIFDEFTCALHEYRALEDFCSAYMRKYEVIAATTNHGRIAIRML